MSIDSAITIYFIASDGCLQKGNNKYNNIVFNFKFPRVDKYTIMLILKGKKKNLTLCAYLFLRGFGINEFKLETNNRVITKFSFYLL